MIDSQLTLRDLGERRIVSELIAPRFPPLPEHIIGIGDDCAVLPCPPQGEDLVLTTDPCPEPVICQLQTYDYYHHGRLTVLINVSDLAAMGARPLGLLVSTIMPETMLIGSYQRFLDGVSDAANEWNCPVIGGNIKDGKEFSATGSALGSVPRNRLLRRLGAKKGDHVCVVGDMGVFWAAVMNRLDPKAVLDEQEHAFLERALTLPVARIREGLALAETGGCTACMDSSDGVGGTLQELSRVNGVNLIIRSSALRPHRAVEKVAAAAAIDVRKLMLAWGDWQLVCTIAPEAISCVSARMAELGTAMYEIGRVEAGDGHLLLEESEDQTAPISNFASERFSKSSLFTHGLGPYIDLLRKMPLVMSHRDPIV